MRPWRVRAVIWSWEELPIVGVKSSGKVLERTASEAMVVKIEFDRLTEGRMMS